MQNKKDLQSSAVDSVSLLLATAPSVPHNSDVVIINSRSKYLNTVTENQNFKPTVYQAGQLLSAPNQQGINVPFFPTLMSVRKTNNF